MNRMLCAAVTLFLAASAVADSFVAHAVVLPSSDRAFVASWPISERELSDAKTLFIWTDELPVQRFTREEFLRARARIEEELRRSAGVQRIRVISTSRNKDLSDVAIRYGPVEMWARVPESLLPLTRPSADGFANVPYRGEAIRLRAMRSGEGTSWTDVRATKGVVHLEMTAAADALVSLVGESRIENATATLMKKPDGGARLALLAQFAADEKGRLALPSIPQFDAVTLLIIAPGYAANSISGVPADLTRTVELTRAGAIRGRFVDAKHKPVAGARVEVEAWLAEDLPALSRAEAVSDAEGKWIVRDLALRETTLLAQAKGFSAYHDTVTPETPELDLGDIELQAAVRLLLEVVDDAGNAVNAASVRMGGVNAGQTNQKGQLAIDDAPATEPAELTISRSGFETTRVTLRSPFAKVEQVTLQRSFIVRGRLVDEDSAPVNDARALVEIGNTYRTETIDSDGAFEIALKHSEEVRLTFESPSTSSQPSQRSRDVRVKFAISE